jgi:hypothetical protein
MVRASFASLESWVMIRRRMLRETEAFLDDALGHPERQIRIPVIRVGQAEFARGFAHLFWSQVFGTS